MHEPQRNIVDSLEAPIEKKDGPNQFDEAYGKEVAEEIEPSTPIDPRHYGAKFDDTLNFSNGLMMIKFVEEAIEKMRNGGSYVMNGADLDTLLKQKEKIEKVVSERRQEMAIKMSKVPMLKLVDKIYFMCGVSMSWLFAYFLGRYPTDLFLTYFTIMIIPLTIWRYFRYT